MLVQAHGGIRKSDMHLTGAACCMAGSSSASGRSRTASAPQPAAPSAHQKQAALNKENRLQKRKQTALKRPKHPFRQQQHLQTGVFSSASIQITQETHLRRRSGRQARPPPGHPAAPPRHPVSAARRPRLALYMAIRALHGQGSVVFVIGRVLTRSRAPRHDAQQGQQGGVCSLRGRLAWSRNRTRLLRWRAKVLAAGIEWRRTKGNCQNQAAGRRACQSSWSRSS